MSPASVSGYIEKAGTAG